MTKEQFYSDFRSNRKVTFLTFRHSTLEAFGKYTKRVRAHSRNRTKIRLDACLFKYLVI